MADLIETKDSVVEEWKARWNHQKKQREAAQLARNKALQSVQNLKARNEALTAQVAVMGEALDFYGQPDLYTVIDRDTALGNDDGNHARKARLAAAKEPV